RRAASLNAVVEDVGARRLDVLLSDRVLIRLAAASDRAARVADAEDHIVVALADFLLRVRRDGGDGGRRGARPVERHGLSAVDQGRAKETRGRRVEIADGPCCRRLRYIGGKL